jgi:transposase-like protein
MLDVNGGNISKTADDCGVSRLTIYRWVERLQNDRVFAAQVAAAKANLANLEELTALKALGEINKRLDERPDKIKDQDLIKFKDSGINNSRLIRGQSTQNIAVSGKDRALEALQELQSVAPGLLPAIYAEMLRRMGDAVAPEADRLEVAAGVEAGEIKLLGDGT